MVAISLSAIPAGYSALDLHQFSQSIVGQTGGQCASRHTPKNGGVVQRRRISISSLAQRERQRTVSNTPYEIPTPLAPISRFQISRACEPCRDFGSWMSAPKCLFFQDFEGLTEVFAPGRPPGYPRGRPRDIRPENLLFGLLFRS